MRCEVLKRHVGLKTAIAHAVGRGGLVVAAKCAQETVGRLLQERGLVHESWHGRRGADGGGDVHIGRIAIVEHERRAVPAP